MNAGDAAALSGAFGFALVGIVVKPVTPRVGAMQINVVYVFCIATVGLFAALIAGQFGEAFSLPATDSSLLIVGAIFGLMGDIALFRSITLGNVGSNYTTATSVFVFGGVFGGMVVFGESVPGLVWVGALLIVSGVYLTNTAVTGIAPMRRRRIAGRLSTLRGPGGLAVLAGTLWAISLLITDEGLGEHDAISANAIAHVGAAAFYLVLIGSWPAARPFGIERRDWPRLLLGGAIFGGTVICFLIALRLSNASSTAILLSSSPLFAIPLAAIVLKERLTRQSGVGVLLSLTGVFVVVGLT